jgi:hypothetical protein
MTDYAVQTSVDAERERLSKKLREFRGDVLSRGFDIENVLSDIITHLLYINRPRYESETDDEFRFHLQCTGFIRDDFLENRSFGFGRKITLAKKILDWIPKRLRHGIDLPEKLLDYALSWRNSLAHDRIEFTTTEGNSLVATLKQHNKHGKTSDRQLTDDQIKIVTDELERCYVACCELEGRLRTRYGDARPKSA